MITRYRLLAPIATACIVASARPTSAEDVVVPIAVQADLTAKVVAYDRNFATRAGTRARVLVFYKSGDLSSAKTAEQMQKSLGGIAALAGLPHDEEQVAFAGRAHLAQACKAKRAAMVYLASGFTDAEISGIAEALNGIDVLTVSALARYVPNGAVLGFDLVSGKPKLLVHLGQARRQKVAFSAEVLKLMKVYE